MNWKSKALTALGAWLLVVGAVPADEFMDAVRAGTEEAKRLTQGYATGVTTDSDGRLILLFPDTAGGGQTSISPEEMFNPGWAGGSDDAARLRQDHGSSDAMVGTGGAAQLRLQDEDSLQGDAYRIVQQERARPRPDLRQDPVFGQSDAVYAGLENFAREFADCSVVRTPREGGFQARLPDLRRCERVNKLQSCTRERHLTARRTAGSHGTVLHFSGCLAGNSYKAVHVYGAAASPYSLHGGYIDAAAALGYWTNAQGYFRGAPLDGTPPGRLLGNYTFRPLPLALYDPEADHEVRAVLTLADGRSFDMPVTLSTVTGNEAEPALPGDITARVDINGSGFNITSWDHLCIQWVQLGSLPMPIIHGFKADLHVIVGSEHVEVEQVNDPYASCTGGNDGFCEARWTCEDDAPRTINGVLVDERYAGQFSPLFPGDSNERICHLARAEYDCNFNVGQADCFVDANGNEQCWENQGELADTCGALESNPQCGFVSSRCVEDAFPEGGNTCYVAEETWDCGQDVTIPTGTIETSMECAGPVRCVGPNCFEPPLSQSEDFARAAAALQAAEFMSRDMGCDEAGNCGVFIGEALECKKAVGGIQNCCNVPTHVSLFDYLVVMTATRNMLSGTAAYEAASSMAMGAWETLSQPVSNAWSAVRGNFASQANAASASTTAAASEEAAKGAMSQFGEKVTTKAAEMVADFWGDAARDAVFQETAAGSGSYMVKDNIASLAGGVMTAYMYYQMFVILTQIVFECEDTEFELAGKRELKACTYVGSYCKTGLLACIEMREAYCCYSSPLARIIQEQATPALGIGFGRARNPSCPGIPLDRIDEINWSAIDLDEWLAILALHDMLPDAQSLLLETMTGDGSSLNVDGDRPSTLERNQQRLEGFDGDGARRAAEEHLRGGG